MLPQEVFCKKGFLKRFAKLTGKQLCWILFLHNRSFFLSVKQSTHKVLPSFILGFHFQEICKITLVPPLSFIFHSFFFFAFCFFHLDSMIPYNPWFPVSSTINPLSANFTKWSNTLKQFVGKLRMNSLSVFDHFVGLALKGLSSQLEGSTFYSRNIITNKKISNWCNQAHCV